jgi:ABC-type multidrug transport system ATPase subunit
MNNTITVSGIKKTFGNVVALRDINLSVESGELFGLIGADGAGKSTLFRILTTLLTADEGTATVGGNDVIKNYKAIRQSIGYMPGRFSLYPDLSVEENLDFFATIFKTSIKENYDLIKEIYIQLEPFKNRPAGKLSGGMKQKLALCCALIHKPEILFLDEPTTGVDPVSRHDLWEMLGRLNKSGITILVSTSYMDEAARCNRIALIQAGTILAVDTPAGIAKMFNGKIFGFKTARMFHLLKYIRNRSDVLSCVAFGDFLHVVFKESLTDLNSVIAEIKKEFPDLQYTELDPGIEDLFIQLLLNSENNGKSN